MTIKSLRVLAITAFAALSGCNLDKTNPNAPTQSTILGGREGVTALAIGLQTRRWCLWATRLYPASSGCRTC